MIAAADPFSLAGSDLAAAAVGSADFAAGSVVVVVVAVDSAATVLVAAGPDFAVAVDLACSVGSVCSFAAERGKGRVVVALSCFLTPRSSF